MTQSNKSPLIEDAKSVLALVRASLKIQQEKHKKLYGEYENLDFKNKKFFDKMQPPAFHRNYQHSLTDLTYFKAEVVDAIARLDLVHGTEYDLEDQKAIRATQLELATNMVPMLEPLADFLNQVSLQSVETSALAKAVLDYLSTAPIEKKEELEELFQTCTPDAAK